MLTAEARKGYYAAVKDFQRISRSTLNSGLNPELLGPLTRMAYHKIREGMATLDQFIIHVKDVWKRKDLTPEELEMIDEAWKKGGEDVETGVTYADEFNETSNVKPKENDNLGESSLKKVQNTGNLLDFTAMNLPKTLQHVKFRDLTDLARRDIVGLHDAVEFFKLRITKSIGDRSFQFPVGKTSGGSFDLKPFIKL